MTSNWLHCSVTWRQIPWYTAFDIKCTQNAIIIIVKRCVSLCPSSRLSCWARWNFTLTTVRKTEVKCGGDDVIWRDDFCRVNTARGVSKEKWVHAGVTSLRDPCKRSQNAGLEQWFSFWFLVHQNTSSNYLWKPGLKTIKFILLASYAQNTPCDSLYLLDQCPGKNNKLIIRWEKE